MNVKNFENIKWKNKKQNKTFRHVMALGMIDKGKVLDLGCGDGLFLNTLKKKGFKAMGLDISEEAIRKCRKKGLSAEVFDFGKQKLNFKDNEFDYVVMLDILEHLYNPAFLLKEAKRVSKKYLLVSIPNFNSLPARIQVLCGRVPENNKPNKGHIYWFNYNTLLDLIKKENLKIKEEKFNTFWENKPILGLINKFLAKKFPQVFSLSFVLKLKK